MPAKPRVAVDRPGLRTQPYQDATRSAQAIAERTARGRPPPTPTSRPVRLAKRQIESRDERDPQDRHGDTVAGKARDDIHASVEPGRGEQESDPRAGGGFGGFALATRDFSWQSGPAVRRSRGEAQQGKLRRP
jgi:hypothetical protein